jgi:ribonucleotide monophosphatase NagD (HAD superfamily)
VDFDGTITPDGKTIFPGCVEVLTELRQNYSIAIFSARPTDAERTQMVETLNTNNVPYDEILPPKPEAAVYLDDKGLKFEGWDKVRI